MALSWGRCFGICLKFYAVSTLFKVPTRKVFVYKLQVNPIHAILKYSNYYDFMER